MTTEGKTIGELLRAAREERKLTIEQVNRETRISIQTLRSLEQDDFASFPSETYLKGFLRNYAEFLGLDGNRLWSMMGQRTENPGRTPSWDIEGTVREEKLGPPRVLRMLAVPVLVAIVIALALMLLCERRSQAALDTAAPPGVHTPSR